jgi:hypothetical protein
MRKRIKPNATVGIPIRALKIPFIMDFPRKSLRPSSIAMGVPHSAASIAAVPEKKRER